MTHVTCRLTAKNRDQLRNPTLGNRVWASFIFFYYNMTALLWLYAGLIGSSNPLWLKADLVVCANPSCSSWVSLNVSSGTGSPGQSRTKGRYMVVCVCVYYHIIAGHYSSPHISCIAIMPPPGSLPPPRGPDTLKNHHCGHMPPLLTPTMGQTSVVVYKEQETQMCGHVMWP